MPSKSIAHAPLFSAAVAVAMALACSDASAPISSRLRGTYELMTVLDSLTYSDYCSHSSGPPVCHDTTVANTTATLHGDITLGDTIQGTPSDMVLHMPAGALEQTICASCAPNAADYLATTATVSRDGLRFEARLDAGVLVVLDGTVANDEITGRVTWHTYLGCCMVNYYTGTFVAKRQP